MADTIEQFNQAQADAKSRLNFLAQLILLTSGGALTASIAVFTGSRNIVLTPELANVLAFSWGFLVGSICFAVVALTIVLLRDYFHAEQWRKQIEDSSVIVDDSPGWSDCTIIFTGVLSVLTFLAGFIGIAYVATSVVLP